MSPTPKLTGLSPSTVPQGAAATITVTGSGFESNSVVMWNGSARPTAFVDGNTLTVSLTAADTSIYGSGKILVNNPGPGGSSTTPTTLLIAATSPTITYLSPPSTTVSTSSVPLSISLGGSGFAPNATVQANGQFLTISSQTSTNITASLPASFLNKVGTVTIAVNNPGSPTVQSNFVTLYVVPASGSSITISPNVVPAGSPDTKITITGSGFHTDSVVNWNSIALSTTYVSSGSLTAIIPANLISGFALANIQVVTPEALGNNPPPQPFGTYLPLPVNDVVYNPVDGLLYASVAGSAGEGLGNSIVAVDPVSAVIQKTIFVGSEPNRIAISTDGTQLFVGLNGAAAFRQVNLTTGMAGTQVSIAGVSTIYYSPNTVQGLAAVPGQANSVAVYTNEGLVTIYDSGVARSKTNAGSSIYYGSNLGNLSFGSSASTLYLNSYTYTNTLYSLTVDSTGITGSYQLGTTNSSSGNIQYDNGRIYLPNGTVVDASSGSQLGQFSTTSTTSLPPATPTAAIGPVVSDSALGRAWILTNSSCCSTPTQILGFDESTFNPVGSIALPFSYFGVTSLNDLVRWGQNGLAFHSGTQLFSLRSPLVKDNTSSPADLATTFLATATATTGTSYSYQIQVSNEGTNGAQGVTLTAILPTAAIYGSVSTSQGTCAGTSVVYCQLGNLANGSSATVTVNVTPTTSGTMTMSANVSSVSYDPVSTNDAATASVAVTGSAYNAVPQVTQVSPALVAAGSSNFTLTVNGTGFVSGSTIVWGSTSLPTTYVNAGQLTALVDASLVTQLGWAPISVQTSAPGGGTSVAMPVHIYNLVQVPANAMTYDPFTRKLYAVLPSTATSISGNSLVSVDPLTGTKSSPISVGSEPNLISETSDGNYLFIGLSGAKSIGRFNMASQTLDLTVSLPSLNSASTGAATILATMPGSDTTLAVGQGSVGILDISGSTGTFRTKATGAYLGSSPVFADASHLYAFEADSNGLFDRYTVDSSGLTQVDQTTLSGLGGYNGTIVLDHGVIFGSGGGMVNPSTTPPSQIATLAIPNSSIYAGITPYAVENKAFGIGQATNGSGVFLERFDTQYYALEQNLQLPTASTAFVGTRWGQDGLAYLVQASGSGSTVQPTQILLVKGPFVLPAEVNSNPAPALTSTDHSTITAGSGNVMVTVTGTGFLPGATVLWNGSARTTTYVDAAHLQVAVAAADVAVAASSTVTCQNPGSSSSNSVTITVQ